MRRLLIVCVGMVLVCGGSAFGGEPKWVCAPEITLPGWYQQLVGEEKVAVSITDFSVVDQTVLALVREPGMFLQIRRVDGSVAEVSRTLGQFGDSAPVLFKDYYVAGGPIEARWNRLLWVEAAADALRAEALAPSAWLLRELLYPQIREQQFIEARTRGGSPPPEAPESHRFPVRVLLFLGPQQFILSFTAAEERLVLLSRAGVHAFVTCFELHSGELLWSTEIPELGGLVAGKIGVEVVGGVVNLLFLTPGSAKASWVYEHVALDLRAGDLLRRAGAGLDAIPRLQRAEDGRRFLLLQQGDRPWDAGGHLALLDEDADTEVWTAQPSDWRDFSLDLTQSDGELFAPFRKARWLLRADNREWEDLLKDEPWAAEARADPFTHGVLCYSASDGTLKATYGLDFRHLSGAPWDVPPDDVRWANDDLSLGCSPSSAPIITKDLVVLSPVELAWSDSWAWAVAVFARDSGDLLDVLWVPAIPRALQGRRPLGTSRKIELHGNELLLLTKDARLCCFELPKTHPERDAGE